MTSSSASLRVEVSISDPWEIASVLPTPLRGDAMHFAGDSVVVRLERPISIDGVAMHFASATPRYVGVHFERSGQPFAANVMLSAFEPSPATRRGTLHKAAAHTLPIATIGTISFVARTSG